MPELLTIPACLRRPAPGPVPPIVALRARLRRRHRLARLPVLALATALALAGPVVALRSLRPEAAPAPPATEPAATTADRSTAPGDATGPGGNAPGPGLGPSPGDGTGPAADGVSPGGGTAPALTDTGPGDDQAAGRLGLAPGERAVALAPAAALPPLTAGDRVELVAVAVGAGGEVTARSLGLTARVLAVEPAAVTVAVRSEAVVELLRHQAQGPIELVLLP